VNWWPLTQEEPIDLDLVEGKGMQSVERGMPGPEIVDRDGNAQGLDPAQDIERLALSAMIALSVISNSICRVDTPASRTTAMSRCRRSPCWNWTGDRLTATLRWLGQWIATLAASRRTHSPMARFRRSLRQSG
jgi:hypothetical protein